MQALLGLQLWAKVYHPPGRLATEALVLARRKRDVTCFKARTRI